MVEVLPTARPGTGGSRLSSTRRHSDGHLVVLHDDEVFAERCAEAAGSIGFKLVRTASTRIEALQAVSTFSPDLIIADLDLINRSGDSGRSFVVDVAREQPDTKVIAVSSNEECAHVRSALAAGFVAYVVKRAETTDLAFAIEQVFRSTVYLVHRTKELSPPSEALVLTQREFQVLQLVSEGHGNKGVAATLSVSDETVKFHLSNVFRKLGVNNRTEAAREAYRLGLLANAG
jgi:DNA-binding NarL/FixJ family response regulator